VGVLPDRDAECARQPKIRQFQRVCSPLNEQVLGFEVAVQDAAGVAVGDAIQHLVQVPLDEDGITVRRRARVHVAFKVQIQVLENQMQLAVLVDDSVQAAAWEREGGQSGRRLLKRYTSSTSIVG
jgi:hypothetical protein